MGNGKFHTNTTNDTTATRVLSEGTQSCGEQLFENARSRHVANQRNRLMNCAAELRRITVDSINRGASHKQHNRMYQTNCNPVIYMPESSYISRYNAQRPLKIEKELQNRAKQSTLTNQERRASILVALCICLHIDCIRSIIEAGIDVAGRLEPAQACGSHHHGCGWMLVTIGAHGPIVQAVCKWPSGKASNSSRKSATAIATDSCLASSRLPICRQASSRECHSGVELQFIRLTATATHRERGACFSRWPLPAQHTPIPLAPTSGSRIRSPRRSWSLLATSFLRYSPDSGCRLRDTHHDAPRCVIIRSCSRSVQQPNVHQRVDVGPAQRLTFCFGADHHQNLQVHQTPNVHANRLQTQSWGSQFDQFPNRPRPTVGCPLSACVGCCQTILSVFVAWGRVNRCCGVGACKASTAMAYLRVAALIVGTLLVQTSGALPSAGIWTWYVALCFFVSFSNALSRAGCLVRLGSLLLRRPHSARKELLLPPTHQLLAATTLLSLIPSVTSGHTEDTALVNSETFGSSMSPACCGAVSRVGIFRVFLFPSLFTTGMGGSTAVNAPAVYGTIRVPSAAAFPGGRSACGLAIDQKKKLLWIFAGSTSNSLPYLGDLWQFSINTGQFSW
jgi:hypothetical protein